jgi:hypothetical protein
MFEMVREIEFRALAHACAQEEFERGSSLGLRRLQTSNRWPKAAARRVVRPMLSDITILIAHIILWHTKARCDSARWIVRDVLCQALNISPALTARSSESELALRDRRRKMH